MEDLASHLNQKFFLSLHSSNKLAEVISTSLIEKGNTFIKKGKINTKEYIVLDGLCRSYITNASGDEVTLSFFTSNTAISPNLTRTVSGNSILNIQTLTDVKLGIFSSEDLMNLMNTNREIEGWANAILQKELLQKVKKEINQNSLKANERLLNFRDQYPSLENLIPHSYIASYLGISNVSLSRLRKELANS